MATRGKVKQLTGELINNHLKLTKPRLELVSLFIISLIQVQTVNMAKIALAMNTSCKVGINYRRLQRFVKDISDFSQLLIPLMIKWLNLSEGSITLLIDRTNWEFGKKKINILMVSALYNGFSVPLCWSLLDKKGNSNQGERRDLVKRLIEILGPGKISYIIGDREFGGVHWYKYLNDNQITFIIRVKENQKVKCGDRKISVRSIIKSHARNGRQCSKKVYVYGGLYLYVCGFRFRNDNGKLEYLILLSQKQIKNISEVYGQRWQIENMFRNMKSNGFNMEQTHLKEDSRIDTLIGLIALSYVWLIKLGLLVKRKQAKIFEPKTHGRPAKSIFKAGLEFLARAFYTNNSADFAVAIKILSCT